MRVTIAGMGKCLPGEDVPGRIVTNADIIEILLRHKALKPGTDRPWTAEELTPQRIVDLVGIKRRQWAAPDVNVSDMALNACEKALRMAGIGWEDVGLLVLGSSTPEAMYPSTSCIVLNKVINRKAESGEWPAAEARTRLRIPAFDLLAACTSGLYGIDVARRMLLQGELGSDHALVVGSEVLSRMLDFSDTNSDLWGDASAAVVLRREDGEGPGILRSLTGSDPWGAENAFSRGQGSRTGNVGVPVNIVLRGHEIQKFVLKIIPELVQKTLDRVNRDRVLGREVGPGDVSLFVCHQANARIFEHPAKKLGVPVERFFVNVDRRGNCSSASVLVALVEAHEEGRIRKGDLVMLLSFGGGLTWSSMLVQW